MYIPISRGVRPVAQSRAVYRLFSNLQSPVHVYWYVLIIIFNYKCINRDVSNRFKFSGTVLVVVGVLQVQYGY